MQEVTKAEGTQMEYDDLWSREQDAYSRVWKASHQIFEIASELKLTLAEFDSAVSNVRHLAIMGKG